MIVPIGRHHTGDDVSAPDGPAAVPAVEGTAVTTEDELRTVIAEPAQVILDKPVAGVDEESRRFLEASSFFLLASSDADGTVDVSPRGDPAGSVLVLDDGRALAFADRNGNRRVDSMRNILRNPNVGLLFLVPGVDHTLRVNGRASIVREGPLLDRLALKGTPPDLAIVVEVDELFVHCGRAMTRSSLWKPESWPENETLPTAGTLFKSQAELRVSLAG
nr:MSMEG_1061 family FMN-dependent PPOX-type flavoprotein [Prauserella cavernicola]